MNDGPLIVSSNSVSGVWIGVMEALLRRGVARLTPVVAAIDVSEDANDDDGDLQRAIDIELTSRRLYSINTTANTIFPRSLWDPTAPRSLVYGRYLRILPVLKRLDRRNQYGTYFERLIAYRRTPDDEAPVINQLEHIVTTYQRGNRRRSALQAALFNPAFDQNHQRRRGFPCLQYVTFDPDPRDGLQVTGVYTTQYVFDRGFGNYLGVFNLGLFMAHEMNLSLTKVTTITMRAELGAIRKTDGTRIVENLKN